MARRSSTIRIAMLNTDTPVPNVAAQLGSYGRIFHHLLNAAATRVSPQFNVASQDFNVVFGEYPERVQDFDALVITGSSASAYDDDTWIKTLDTFLHNVYETMPSVKIFGSCFGHQILCQSLLRECGAIVEKDPKGWEIGVSAVQLSDDFAATMETKRADAAELAVGNTRNQTASRFLRLQFVHADHVYIPSLNAIPKSWMLVGSTSHCTIQGVYEPGRILTYQGHFEFDRFVNSETVKVFGASWESEVLQDELKQIDADDDAELAAERVVQFVLESSPIDSFVEHSSLLPADGCNETLGQAHL